MKTQAWIHIAVSVLAFVVVVTPAAYGLDLRSRIDPLANPLVKDSVAVGFVVGIVKDGQTQVLVYGETERGSGGRPAVGVVVLSNTATERISQFGENVTRIAFSDKIEPVPARRSARNTNVSIQRATSNASPGTTHRGADGNWFATNW